MPITVIIKSCDIYHPWKAYHLTSVTTVSASDSVLHFLKFFHLFLIVQVVTQWFLRISFECTEGYCSAAASRALSCLLIDCQACTSVM